MNSHLCVTLAVLVVLAPYTWADSFTFSESQIPIENQMYTGSQICWNKMDDVGDDMVADIFICDYDTDTNIGGELDV